MKIDRAEFARLNEGMSIAELADHFAVQPRTISRLRKQLDAPRDNRMLMTPERRAAIERMLADEWSFAEIHRTEGADMETLRKHFPGQSWTQQQANQFRSETRQARRRLAA